MAIAVTKSRFYAPAIYWTTGEEFRILIEGDKESDRLPAWEAFEYIEGAMREGATAEYVDDPL